MAKYIDADELRARMYHEAFETDSDMQRWDSGCWIRYKMFENALEQMPAADVVDKERYDRLLENSTIIADALSECQDAHNEGYDVGYWAGRRDYEPRWIPVTERLPAHGEDVILSMYGDYCIGYLVSTYEGIGYEWHHSGWIYDFDEVQAWMPLPEPYKEGEQE